MKAPSLRTLSIVAVAAVAVAYSLVFFYAPNDADQGFIQKIFYLHVPLAICALAGFIVGAYHAIQHLRTGDAKHDARSYVSIHMSVIFGVAVLVTGSIWARASWGKWWVWQEPTLVSFLIVFLLYCTYYPLRYAIADRERQAPLRVGVRDHRRRLRAAQLPRRPPGSAARPPAGFRDGGWRAHRKDGAELPGLLGGHWPSLGDAGALRARRQGHARQGLAPAPRAGG